MNRFLVSYTSDCLGDFVKNNMKYIVMVFLFLPAQLALAQTQTSESIDSQANTSQIPHTMEITLIELGDTLTLYPDSTCRINLETQIRVEAIEELYQSIVDKPYLDRLSGLAILEQVKQRAQQSRMVIAIDSDLETKLTIHTSENTQNISLYSIDLMHSTYPKAELLGQFMEIVELMRKAKEWCVD